MVEKYQKRKAYELKVSERQLEQMSILHVMFIFSENNNLAEISNVNPKWLEMRRIKRFGLHSGQLENLQKTGIWDSGSLKIRKAKKGYVIEQIYRWRSKGMDSKKLFCDYCKKSELVNIMNICEKCEKELKSKRKYQKFLWRGYDG